MPNTKPNMPKAEFDQLLAVLRPAMWSTWQTIAGDLEAACAECGERLTNSAAVESCLDGGGLMADYGNDGGAAHKALDAACKQYDYLNLYRRVCRAVRLV